MMGSVVSLSTAKLIVSQTDSCLALNRHLTVNNAVLMMDCNLLHFLVLRNRSSSVLERK